MDTKKIILWPVLISFVGHIVLITVTGMIDLRENIRAEEIIIVNIKEAETEIQPKKEEEKKEEEKKPSQSKEGKDIIVNDGWREETVELGNMDVKYAAYLVKIKKKILRIWKYPDKAFKKNKEGTVVVKLSIDASGTLAATTLMSSSGAIELDEGALGVVKDAAPFDPLPEQYNLSRLNILASFRYKIMD